MKNNIHFVIVNKAKAARKGFIEGINKINKKKRLKQVPTKSQQ